MKKMTLMMILGLMVTPVFAGLVADPGFDNEVVDVSDLGDTDGYYEPAEYVSGMWVAVDTNSATSNAIGGNPGNCVRVRTAALRAIGSVTDNDAVSTGNLWAYTVDLQNDNGGVTAGSTITLVVQGLAEPWNATGWKNRINALNWIFEDGTGVELINVPIDPTAVGASWTTFSGVVDLGAGYKYLAAIVRADDVGGFESSLKVDNLDIIPIPEPAFLGFLGLGVLAFIRRK